MSDAPTATSLFEQLDDRRFRATELSRGPWDPGACHGGPPSALLAGALHDAADATGLGPFFPARLTAELLRPVPVGDLTVATTMRRTGKRICAVDGTLTDTAGNVCLSASLGAIRDRPFTRPVPDRTPMPPDRAEGRTVRLRAPIDDVMFARNGVEHRVVAGEFQDPGPATDWMRITVDMVDDRPPTPLERVVALADFGNGVAKEFDMADVLFLNPDLSVHLFRLPVGEWVCLDAISRIGPHGVGVAESLLFDDDGPIGRAVQSLLVEDR